MELNREPNQSGQFQLATIRNHLTMRFLLVFFSVLLSACKTDSAYELTYPEIYYQLRYPDFYYDYILTKHRLKIPHTIHALNEREVKPNQGLKLIIRPEKAYFNLRKIEKDTLDNVSIFFALKNVSDSKILFYKHLNIAGYHNENEEELNGLMFEIKSAHSNQSQFILPKVHDVSGTEFKDLISINPHQMIVFRRIIPLHLFKKLAPPKGNDVQEYTLLMSYFNHKNDYLEWLNDDNYEVKYSKSIWTGKLLSNQVVVRLSQ